MGGKKYKVELFVEDSASKPDQAASAAQKLITPAERPRHHRAQFDEQCPARLGNRLRAPRWSSSPRGRRTPRPPWMRKPALPSSTSSGPASSIPSRAGVVAKFALDNLKAKKAAVLYDVASDYNKGIAGVLQEDLRGEGRPGDGIRDLHHQRQGFLRPAHQDKEQRAGHHLSPQLL